MDLIRMSRFESELLDGALYDAIAEASDKGINVPPMVMGQRIFAAMQDGERDPCSLRAAAFRARATELADHQAH